MMLGASDQVVKGLNSNSTSSSTRTPSLPVIPRLSSSSSNHKSSSSSSHHPLKSSTGHHHSSSNSTPKTDSPHKASHHHQNNHNNSHVDIMNALPDPNYRPPIHRRVDEILNAPYLEGLSGFVCFWIFFEENILTVFSFFFFSKSPMELSLDRPLLIAGMKLFPKGRTAVFAGSSKLVTVPKVYPLQELCIRMLMNHIDKICEVGDLPYFILKPVLEKCTVSQLKRIEYYNPVCWDGLHD